jgi:hypothetical protein
VILPSGVPRRTAVAHIVVCQLPDVAPIATHDVQLLFPCVVKATSEPSADGAALRMSKAPSSTGAFAATSCDDAASKRAVRSEDRDCEYETAAEGVE